MTEQELIDLQQKLDTQKYFQSQTIRQDLGGRMQYCNNCYFKKLDEEKGHHICNLDELSKTQNQVCAKNYLREEQNERKPKQSKPRTNRKANNG